jgi:hypothetical protein
MPKTCPVCELGELTAMTDGNDGVVSHYSACYFCGSELAGAEEAKLNAENMLNHLIMDKSAALQWYSLAEGNDGEYSVDVHLTTCATVRDCIKMQRQRYVDRNLKPVSDRELLHEFMALYFATVKES